MIAGVYLVRTAASGFWLGSLVDHHRKKLVMLGSSTVSFGLYALSFALHELAPKGALAEVYAAAVGVHRPRHPADDDRRRRGRDRRLVRPWPGARHGLVFTLAGVVGVLATTAAFNSSYYRQLSAAYVGSGRRALEAAAQ